MRLARAVSLLLFVVLGCYALLLATEDRDQGSVRAIETRLELRQAVTIGQLASAAELALGTAARDCRSNILRPALAVSLYNLNRFNQAVDYDAWAAAHADEQAFIAAMIRCRPVDGNAWLRDALVTRAIAEDPVSLKAKMTLASQLMPYEETQVSARLFLWKRLSPYALSVCADLARADVRAVLLYGTQSMKKSLMEGMSAPFATLLKSEVSTTALYSKS